MYDTFLTADTPEVSVVNDVDDSVTEVSVRGVWNSALRSRTAQQLRGCVAETPRAVIVDLTRLSDPDGASVPFWCAAHRSAVTRTPGIDLILAGVPLPVLSRLLDSTGSAAIHTADTATAAHRLAGIPRWSRWRRIMLPADGASAARARLMAGDACLAWQLPYLLYPALLIVSELTNNAIEHARTDLTVAVSLRGPVLHLAVHDQHRDLPQLIEAAPYRADARIEQRGAGLRLVRSASNAFGALPCRTGKVVWATLDLS